MDSTASTASGFFIMGIVAFFYFLPTIIAAIRKKPNLLSIGLVNFFFGWSVIGWFVALLWAINNPQQQTVIIHNTNGSQA